MDQLLTVVLINAMSLYPSQFKHPWENCNPHLLNCALGEAFRIHLDHAKSRNKEATDLIMKLKQTIENPNKSKINRRRVSSNYKKKS